MKRFTLLFVLSLTGLFFLGFVNSTRQQPNAKIEKPTFFVGIAPKLIVSPTGTPQIKHLLHLQDEKSSSPNENILGENLWYANNDLIKKLTNSLSAVIDY